MSMDKPNGWECPKCGRVHAPSVFECPCSRVADKPALRIMPKDSWRSTSDRTLPKDPTAQSEVDDVQG